VNLGDVCITVLVDCSSDFQGLEAVTAEAIQSLIDLSPPGDVQVSLQRLGVDAEPIRVRCVEASYLRVAGVAGKRVSSLKSCEPGIRHVVIAAFHGQDRCPKVPYTGALRGVYPIIIACGVPHALAQFGTGVPLSHVVSTDVQGLASVWADVRRKVDDLRCLASPSDIRSYGKLAIPKEKRTFAASSDREYARKCGVYYRFAEQRDRQSLHIK